MSLLGRLLWGYVNTLFTAISQGCNILWVRNRIQNPNEIIEDEK